MTATPPDRRRLSFWLAGILLLHILPFVNRPSLIGGDEPHYALMAHSIGVDGDLDLTRDYARVAEGSNEAGRKRAGEELMPHLRELDGRMIYSHPLGLPLLAAPLLALQNLISPGSAPDIPLALLTLAVTFAGILAGWRLLTRLTGSTREAALVACCVYFGSPLWFYSRTFFTEPYTWSFAAIALAFLASGRIAAASLFLGLTLAMKETALLLVGAILVTSLARLGTRKTLALAVGPLVAGIAFIVKNLVVTGAPFATSLPFSLGDPLAGAFGLVADPTNGLLWHAPLLAAAIAGWFLRDRIPRWLPGGALLAVVAYFLLTAAWSDWRGGTVYGTRLMLPVLPALAIPLIALRRSSPAFTRWLFFPLFLAGFVVNWTAALDPFTAFWGLPVWELLEKNPKPALAGVVVGTLLFHLLRTRFPDAAAPLRVEEPPSPPIALGPALRKRLAVAAIVSIALGAALVVGSTWRVFSQTIDEPAHIATGLRWVAEGRYDTDLQHPPLARILFAIGPHLAGAPYVVERVVQQGNAALYCCGNYVRMLSLARAGNLPFLLLAIMVTAAWSWRLYGPWGGVAGALLFATLPPLLAHAGLATNDVAAAATLGAALLAFDLWLERRTWGRTLLLGLSFGGALLAKLSAVAFLPLAMVAILAVHLMGGRMQRSEKQEPVRRRLLAHLALAGIAAFLLVWAVFRFSFGVVFLPEQRNRYDWVIPAPIHGLAHAVGDNIPIPAPELVRGVAELLAHSRYGHFSYFRGEVGTDGWWSYFPVTIGVKTPLAFLILVVAAFPLLIADARRVAKEDRPSRLRHLAPLLAALTILGVAMASSINIGVRHILPIYPLLAVVAVRPLVFLFSGKPFGPAIAIAILSWQLADAARAHPDHLAWFNPIASEHPEQWLLDSNLDWGQDLLRLEAAARRHGMDSLALSYFGTALPERHELPPLRPVEGVPIEGWVAVSLMNRMGPAYGSAEPVFEWLDAYEPERIGKSILLFHIQPQPDERILLPILLGPEPLADPRGPRWTTNVRVRSDHESPVEVRLGETSIAIPPGVSEPETLRFNAVTGVVLSAPPEVMKWVGFELELRDAASGARIAIPAIRARAAGAQTLRFELAGEPRERSLRIQDLASAPESRVRFRMLDGERVIEERAVALAREEASGPSFATIDLPPAADARFVVELEPIDPRMKLWAMIVETDPVTGAIEVRLPR